MAHESSSEARRAMFARPQGPGRRSAVRTLLILAVVGCLAAGAEARTVVKMATLVPEGSVWDQILREMGEQWRSETDGEVSLRLYPGGVAGDEPDIVRKMRVGQLQAAALSVAGLTAIDRSFEIFEIPMFFDSYGELHHVLDTLRPEFEKRLEAKGYVLLSWGNGGWVHLFSKAPIATVDDLRQQKIFSWAGNEAMSELWRKNNFQAVSLAATDILTSLQTGIVEVVPTTPLAALSLQWFRQTPHMQDLGLAPLVGATVISNRAWKRLDEPTRKAVLAAARSSEDRLRREIAVEDAKAVEQMRARGLTVTEVDAATRAQWSEVAEIFARFRRENMEDRALLDRVQAVRDEFRVSSGE
ncbi:MAG: TRAP transporter substrate-binding protein DctP [Acidobacteriota bacterium]